MRCWPAADAIRPSFRGAPQARCFDPAAAPAAIGNNNTINNFNPNTDQIDFNAALFASYTAAQSGANTIITVAPGNTVTLTDVAATSLTANTVHFT